MFRKKTSTLERSLKAAGVDLGAPLGKHLLNKMFEYGYEDKKVVIERIGEFRFDVLEPVHHNEGDYLRCAADVELIYGTNDWYVAVPEVINALMTEWRSEVVYSERDLFGESIDNVSKKK